MMLAVGLYKKFHEYSLRCLKVTENNEVDVDSFGECSYPLFSDSMNFSNSSGGTGREK